MNIYELAKDISKIPPGCRITVSRFLLNEIAASARLVGSDGPTWAPAERVMENIIGSAYEFRFWADLKTENVIFERLSEPLNDGSRTYVSPDRRAHYQIGKGGRYWPNPQRSEG